MEPKELPARLIEYMDRDKKDPKIVRGINYYRYRVSKNSPAPEGYTAVTTGFTIDGKYDYHFSAHVPNSELNKIKFEYDTARWEQKAEARREDRAMESAIDRAQQEQAILDKIEGKTETQALPPVTVKGEDGQLYVYTDKEGQPLTKDQVVEAVVAETMKEPLAAAAKKQEQEEIEKAQFFTGMPVSESRVTPVTQDNEVKGFEDARVEQSYLKIDQSAKEKEAQLLDTIQPVKKTESKTEPVVSEPIVSTVTAAEPRSKVATITSKIEEAVLGTISRGNIKSVEELKAMNPEVEAIATYAKESVIDPPLKGFKEIIQVTPQVLTGKAAASTLYKSPNVQDYIAAGIVGGLSKTKVVTQVPLIKQELSFGKGAAITAAATMTAADPVREKAAEVGQAIQVNREKQGDIDLSKSFTVLKPVIGTPVDASALSKDTNTSLTSKAFYGVKGVGNYALSAAGGALTFAAENPVGFYALGKGAEVASGAMGSKLAKVGTKLGLEKSPTYARITSVAPEVVTTAAFTTHATVTAPEGKRLKTAVGMASLPVVAKGAEVAYQGAKVGTAILTKDYYRQYELDPKQSYSFAPREEVINPETPLRLTREAESVLKNIEAQGKAPEDVKIKTYSQEDVIIKEFLKKDEGILTGSRNMYNQLKGSFDTAKKDFDVHVKNPQKSATELKQLLEYKTQSNYDIKVLNTDAGKVFRIQKDGRDVVDFAKISGEESPVVTGEGIRVQNLNQEIWTKARTFYEPKKTTGRARAKDLPKLMEALQYTDNTIKTGDIFVKENVAWHAGKSLPFIEEGTFKAKQITPSQWETLTGQGEAPITFFGQNEFISFFRKGSGDVIRLSERDTGFITGKDLPREFQKPAKTREGAIAQTKRYIEFLKKNEGVVAPSPQTVTGRTFRGKKSPLVEKEMIVYGDIPKLKYTGFGLDPYSKLSEKFVRVITKEQKSRGLRERVRENIKDIAQDMRVARLQKRTLQTTKTSEVTALEKLYLERMRSTRPAKVTPGRAPYSAEQLRNLQRSFDQFRNMPRTSSGYDVRRTQPMNVQRQTVRTPDYVRDLTRTIRTPDITREILRPPTRTPDYTRTTIRTPDITRIPQTTYTPYYPPTRNPPRPPTTTQKPPTITEIITPSVPKPPVTFNLPDKKQKPQYEKGFNVFVKSNKEWVKVNQKPLPKTSALSLGARATDETAAASFRISQGKKALKQKIQDTYYRMNLNKYRGSKNKRNVIVERSINRMDTVGELNQITVKGWLASRRKAQAANAAHQSLLKKAFGGM